MTQRYSMFRLDKHWKVNILPNAGENSENTAQNSQFTREWQQLSQHVTMRNQKRHDGKSLNSFQ